MGGKGEEGGRMGGGGIGRGTKKGAEGRGREEGRRERRGGGGSGNRPPPGPWLSASRPAPRMLSSARLHPMYLAVCAAAGPRATPGRRRRRAARAGSGPRRAVREGGGRRGSQDTITEGEGGREGRGGGEGEEREGDRGREGGREGGGGMEGGRSDHRRRGRAGALFYTKRCKTIFI